MVAVTMDLDMEDIVDMVDTTLEELEDLVNYTDFNKSKLKNLIK
jgi:hypothetical protein